jgi:flagellin
MNVINTNIGAMKATNSANAASKMLGTAMERLSTGKRINSAKDDAAGLAIATTMTSQVRGMNQGIRNANDGISMAQTAEGALSEVTNMLQRVRELSVQAASETYSGDDRLNLQTEIDALQTQMTNVLTNTEFNGNKLFDGSAGTGGVVKIQTGANATDTVSMTFSDLSAVAGTAGGGAYDPVAGTRATTGTYEVVGESGTTAQATIAVVDTQLDAISAARAGLGASQNQLESAVNTMTTGATNLSDARSRIEDTDYSAETTALAKAQILSQASSAMLAQANQSQQSVLSLLR